MKTVIVLGGSYSGSRAAELLSKSLPKDYRVVLIEKQTHFNHLYLFPRTGVVPNFAHQVFVPYDNLLNQSNKSKINREGLVENEGNELIERKEILASICINASVISIQDGFIELDRDLSKSERGEETKDLLKGLNQMNLNSNNQIQYNYLIYALGCTLPPPLLSSALTKLSGIQFLKSQQDLIAKSSSILIIGGGALGIQYATDIACFYAETSKYKHLHPINTILPKKVTLLHSRDKFLPIYKDEVHEEVMRRLEELEIVVGMGERVILPSKEELLKEEREGGLRKIKTEKGNEYEYDLLLTCTGQKPNSKLLSNFIPESINLENYIKVKSTLQIDIPSTSIHFEKASRIFAIGDVADAGVIKAGHTGWNQAGTAVNNILSLIKDETMILEEYQRSVPMIKVTLGMNHTVSELFEGGLETEVKRKCDAPIDGNWSNVWTRMGMNPTLASA